MKEYKFARYNVKLVRETQAKYKSINITKAGDMAAVLCNTIKLYESAEEKFCMISLDNQHKVTGVFVVHVGTLSTCNVHPREIFKRALLVNAQAIILAHNHPSGSLEPSAADRSMTDEIVKAGKLMGINVLDHIIIAPDKSYASLKDIGYIY